MGRFFTFISLLIIIFLINTYSVKGQADSIRYQIGIGVWPTYIKDPFLNIEFKKYYKRRTFFEFSVEGFYNGHNNGEQSSDYDYQIATSAAVGIYFNFFKICRFNMAAQLTGFFARQRTIEENSNPTYEYGRVREGVFIGPEFSLEFRMLRFKASEITFFSKIHSGFGLMHEEAYKYGVPDSYNTDESYSEWYRSSTIGIGYRF